MTRFLALLSCIALVACTKASDPTPVADTPPLPADPAAKITVGYVLHGLNEFTQVIKRGAEDAGKELGVEVEVVGPAGFTASEAIGMFEGMTQKKKSGLVVVPMPGELWVKPIQEAMKTGLPVLTSNITSPDSGAESWCGQDEYQSGVILADEMKKALAAAGKKSGTIAVGICAPGVQVLLDRYNGFKKGMEGTAFKVTEPTDVTTESTSNYSAWENMAGKDPNTVAIIGLCSMDLPNLYKLKERNKSTWLIGGYDLSVEVLESVKRGTVQVVLGQHPYLQGYLPVKALVEHLRNGKPLPKGWLDVGTEIITKENVDTVLPRESDKAEETKWYAADVAKRFPDISGGAKPMPAKR